METVEGGIQQLIEHVIAAGDSHHRSEAQETSNKQGLIESRIGDADGNHDAGNDENLLHPVVKAKKVHMGPEARF
jgi:hypothetical protein